MTIREGMRRIAEMHGIGFKDGGEETTFFIYFNADFYWHEVALMVRWKRNGKGLNWWTDDIFDGKHRMVGPGYPAYAIHPQKPISEEALLKMIDGKVADMTKYYKQFNYHI